MAKPGAIEPCSSTHIWTSGPSIVDELGVIAQAHDTTVARAALAWLRDVNLTPEELARLGALTQPVFGFPQNMAPMFPSIHNGGTTVNGVYGPPSSFVIEKGEKPY